jgi:hypothetical protein
VSLHWKFDEKLIQLGFTDEPLIGPGVGGWLHSGDPAPPFDSCICNFSFSCLLPPSAFQIPRVFSQISVIPSLATGVVPSMRRFRAAGRRSGAQASRAPIEADPAPSFVAVDPFLNKMRQMSRICFRLNLVDHQANRI